MRIGFFSCQEWNGGFYTAHAALAEEQDLDVVVCLGDYIYERNYYESGARTDTTGPNRDGDVQTLPEYRDKYRLYHTDSNLLRVRETHSLLATWDDHEAEDNYAGDREGEATPVNRVPFLERRANGYQAFFEHMPLVRDSAAPDRIYGQATLGRHAELFVLDQRRYRSDQPCNDAVATPCPEAEAAGRTMLGAEQKAWFKGALAGSRATWKLVGQPADGDGARGRAARRVVHLRLVGRLQGRAARAAGVHPRPPDRRRVVPDRRHPHVLRRQRHARRAARASASRARSRPSSWAARSPRRASPTSTPARAGRPSWPSRPTPW